MRGGERVEDLWRLVLAKAPTPEERAGDLDARLAALRAGRKRLGELVSRRGAEEVSVAMAALVRYADRMVQAGLARILPGRYQGEDFREDDVFGSGPLPIRVRLEGSIGSRTTYRVANHVMAATALGSMSAVKLKLPEGYRS